MAAQSQYRSTHADAMRNHKKSGLLATGQFRKLRAIRKGILMKKHALFGWSLACVAALILTLAGTSTAVASAWGERFGQAGKGLLNMSTCWLEIPGCMVDVSQKKNPWAGCSWGLLKGMAFVPLRFEQGFFEFMTSPIAPHQPKTTSIGPKTTIGYFTGETSEPTGQPVAQPAVKPPAAPEPRPRVGK